MRMVCAGEMPSTEFAACWRVEVVKGGFGERFTSVFLMPVTCHLPAFASASIDSASSRSRGSFSHASTSESPFSVANSPEIVQNDSGTNARISGRLFLGGRGGGGGG